MKKLFLSILACSILLGCDNPVSKKIKEAKENVSNTTRAVKEMTNLQDDIEELQNVEPLTNEDLKKWLPDEIDGMKRISYKAGQMGMVQIASAEAVYANEDKTRKFKIEVIDGAGQMGAAATAAMRIMFTQEFEEESEYKTRRTTTKNGVKAIEEYRKNNNSSTIEFMKDKRFYLKATGTNMSLEETWDAIDDLDADDLS
ncbi:hypothetical protein [Ulvibacter antarcticus]|uniref:Lipoprotein n=1 Tax=Ulvibacter antarcticus TaxID=442714 RepID=A0A3L9Z286_9FLAO|nr:hypothetical protein [Ulvibacter antarcticus]RMA66240.1 hypothetical protein BXY75_0660 [Ulvibacter antarcticus]